MIQKLSRRPFVICCTLSSMIILGLGVLMATTHLNEGPNYCKVMPDGSIRQIEMAPTGTLMIPPCSGSDSDFVTCSVGFNACDGDINAIKGDYQGYDSCSEGFGFPRSGYTCWAPVYEWYCPATETYDIAPSRPEVCWSFEECP